MDLNLNFTKEENTIFDFIKENSHKCCNIEFRYTPLNRNNFKDFQNIKECKLCLLSIACKKSNLEMCKLLVHNIKFKTFESSFHICPLHISCDNGNFEICKFLIQNGASVNTHDRKKDFPLNLAVSNGNFEICKLLIENEANVNQTFYGRTLLYIASVEGYYKICKLLLENGANVNKIVGNRNNAEDRTTALHMSIETRHLDISKLLIENGADLKIKDSDSYTPLELYVKNDNINEIEFAKFLIEKGAEINQKIGYIHEFDGNILNLAYRTDSQDFYSFLLKNGYDINQSCDNGDTMLHYAASYKYKKMSEFLIKNGANVNQKNLQGLTPLHFCCSCISFFPNPERSKSNFEIHKLLLENGVDINLKTKNGHTAIQLSLVSKEFDISRSLIERENEIIKILFFGHKRDPNCLFYEYNFPWSVLRHIINYSGYSYKNYLDRVRTGILFLFEEEDLNEKYSIANKKTKIEK